jgi:hypothetical protein
MLAPSTDVDDLARRAFVHLDGVSDDWLQSLPVEKVAGGQVPRNTIVRYYAMNNVWDNFCAPCLLSPPE